MNEFIEVKFELDLECYELLREISLIEHSDLNYRLQAAARWYVRDYLKDAKESPSPVDTYLIREAVKKLDS